MSLRLKFSTVLNGKAGSLVDQAIVSGSHFFISIVLARYLGVETFGWFALGWMVLLFVSSLQQAFIITPMLSLYPQIKDSLKSKIYKTGLKQIQLLFLIATVIVSVFAYFIISILNNDTISSQIYFLFLAITFFFLCHDFIRKKFYAEEKNSSALYLDALAYIPQLIFLIVLVASTKITLVNSLISILAGYVISVFCYIMQLVPKANSINSFKTTFSKHWIFSRWLLGKSILQWFSGNYFVLAAGAIIGASALGFIRMAQTLIGLLNVLFLAFENFLPVQAAQQFKNDGLVGLKNHLVHFTKNYGVLVLAGLIFVFVFANYFGQYVFNETDVTLSFLIRGYCLLYCIVFLAIPLRIFLRTIEKTNILFWAYLIATGFSVITANYFINQFGYTGVIAGIIINQIILVVYYFVAIYKSNKTLTIKSYQVKDS